MNPITGLLVALSALTAVFVGGWSRMLPSSKERPGFPNLLQIGVGAFTNFFDTLGIGSYATSTTLFRFFQLVDDSIIPGTLNVGHALPTVVQTFIYTSIIPVDVPTLFSMIGASILGAWLGAGVVARWPRRTVQIGMGMALLVAASLMFMTQMKLFPGGGEELHLGHEHETRSNQKRHAHSDLNRPPRPTSDHAGSEPRPKNRRSDHGK